MSRFAILFIMLALSTVVASQGQTKRRPKKAVPAPTPRNTAENGNWVKFTSELGRFSVLLPEVPTSKTETTPSEPAPYTTHMFVARDSKNIYMVAWVDYDPGFDFHNRSEMYANRDYFVKNMNATLVNSRLLRVDGYQTLEFRAESVDRIFKSRV